jgi:hypothetical protein
MADLLGVNELPDGFTYPPEFVRVVDLGLTNLEPWWILDGRLLRDRYAGMSLRYPQRPILPFAKRQDNDDVACWDLQTGRVVIVHDFADPGWEERKVFPNFNAWLRQAFDDMIQFQ